MKILVVSDTHGDIQRLRSLVRGVRKGIAALIHCGDHDGDALEVQKLYPDLPVYTVRGNCDFGNASPLIRVEALGGKKILITHGHRHDVKGGLINLAYTCLENGADICVFGHTHVPMVETYQNSIVMLNPGSLSRPRGFSRASYGVIDISPEGEIDVKIVEYK